VKALSAEAFPRCGAIMTTDSFPKLSLFEGKPAKTYKVSVWQKGQHDHA